MTGIYSIEINNKLYIGSSYDIKGRWRQHKSDLKNNRHHNAHLQAAYNKYHNIKFTLLEHCETSISDEDLRALEKQYKEKLGYYNIQDPETHFGIKEVYQFNKDGTFIKKYASCAEAAQELQVSISNIMHAAQENEIYTKSAAGFYWSYTSTLSTRIDKRETPVHQYDIEGKYITSFKSLKELHDNIFPNIKYSTMAQAINDCHNYIIASYGGYRYSYIKTQQLDNTKLLFIRKNYPVIQILDNKIVKIWSKAAEAAKVLNCRSCEITEACKHGTKVRGYKWQRLGTKSSELLEHPEDIKAKA